ncbi:uncharacterized protein LTHEOB_4216 [Lasiodiplodia theobromae]|uniref:uncharacterized protein n=1 Tax=Lasiodiplodia theobromae TaxID=45133 RepID=UPI0015C35CA8|nr:uncharacterized protein LTHEOB_4216 [Lasiodiplodia theobromae]KAF4546219.1 hypothetical protein LTHEOB_4216 [Lasiodiplodia theobromae]
MAPIGGVVTQSLTQTSELSGGSKLNPHHHHDAAQIARIWMSMPARSDQQQAPLVAAARDESAEQRQGLAAGGPVSPAGAGPTRARDRRPAAADQTQPSAQTSITCSANTAAAAPAGIARADPNDHKLYDQLQSPLFGKLPAELRLLVWEHALTPTAAIDRPTVAVSLLESCRRAYDETKLMVFERNQVRAHLLKSPPPPPSNSKTTATDQHWTRFLSPAQQAATHLNLYVQPGASSSWGWNLVRWTKMAGDFAPHTLQLTLWFTSSGGWWAHHMSDIFKNISSLRRPIRAFVLEFRTERDRFAEFDKRVQELRDRRIVLSDERKTALVWDGEQPKYFEGSRVMMDSAFGRPTWLPEDEQPRWVSCLDPEKEGEREMLATVIRWEAESSA